MSNTAQNVAPMNGGKVHTAMRAELTNGDAFPFCRTGGQNTNGTMYVFTDRPVTCAACLMNARYARAVETLKAHRIALEPGHALTIVQLEALADVAKTFA